MKLHKTPKKKRIFPNVKTYEDKDGNEYLLISDEESDRPVYIVFEKENKNLESIKFRY